MTRSVSFWSLEVVSHCSKSMESAARALDLCHGHLAATQPGTRSLACLRLTCVIYITGMTVAMAPHCLHF